MPEPPSPELLTNASQWQTYLTGFGVIIGGAALAFRTWAKEVSTKTEPGSHIVLESASIADVQPLRDAVKCLKDILEEIRGLSTAVKERIEHEKDEAEIERRARAMFQQMVDVQSTTHPTRRQRPSRAKT